MPMLPYPPPTKPDAAENSWLRALGGTLALLSILLTLLGIILHQRVPDLILAIIVGMFALRVLILWLGDKSQHPQPSAVWSFRDPIMYPMQSPPYTQEQPTPYASPYSQSQPFYQIALDPHMRQTVPMPPAAIAPPPPKLPRSIRPLWPPKASAFPTQSTPPPQVVPPLPPSPPPSLWLPPLYASIPMPSPAPLPSPSQQEDWQYDDGKHGTQQGGNDHGTA